MNMTVTGIKLENMELCNGCPFISIKNGCELKYFDNMSIIKTEPGARIERPQKCRDNNQWEVK